jgi:hypothetical protein
MKKQNRTYLEILDDINEVLANSGFSIEAEELKNEIKSSFTSTEICLRCGSKLLSYQNNKKLTNLIRIQINEFIDYCHFIGLFPIPINE